MAFGACTFAIMNLQEIPLLATVHVLDFVVGMEGILCTGSTIRYR